MILTRTQQKEEMSVFTALMIFIIALAVGYALIRILPTWLARRKKLLVRMGEQRKVNLFRETAYSHVNWPLAEEKLAEFLQRKIEMLNSLQPRIYEARIFRNSGLPPDTGQFTVKMDRLGLVPEGITAKNHRPTNVHVEAEQPAQLIFELLPVGEVIVLGYPHSSSAQAVNEDHYILHRYRSSSILLEDIACGAVDRIWHEFLIVSEASAFGSGPVAAYAKPRARLARRSRRFTDLLKSDKEKRMEEVRMDVALGAGLTAALFTAAIQAFSKAMPVMPTAIEFLLPMALAVFFAFVLRRIFRR